MMLVVVPAVDLGDRDDRRIEHVDPPGDHRLEGEHDLGGDRDRIDGAVRRRGVTAAPADRDPKGVARRRASARAGR